MTMVSVTITVPNEECGHALQSIADERFRQLAQWGEQTHSLAGWSCITGEEFGEYCKAIFDYAQEKASIREVTKEGIETCATLVAAIEFIIRGGRNGRVPPGILPTRMYHGNPDPDNGAERL